MKKALALLILLQLPVAVAASDTEQGCESTQETWMRMFFDPLLDRTSPSGSSRRFRFLNVSEQQLLEYFTDAPADIPHIFSTVRYKPSHWGTATELTRTWLFPDVKLTGVSTTEGLFLIQHADLSLYSKRYKIACGIEMDTPIERLDAILTLLHTREEGNTQVRTYGNQDLGDRIEVHARQGKIYRIIWSLDVPQD